MRSVYKEIVKVERMRAVAQQSILVFKLTAIFFVLLVFFLFFCSFIVLLRRLALLLPLALLARFFLLTPASSIIWRYRRCLPFSRFLSVG